MLVLTRKQGEKVVIGGNITVTVVETKGNKVRLAFQAPDEVRILRSELVDILLPTDPDLPGIGFRFSPGQDRELCRPSGVVGSGGR